MLVVFMIEALRPTLEGRLGKTTLESEGMLRVSSLVREKPRLAGEVDCSKR